jgi:hypothetical protein
LRYANVGKLLVPSVVIAGEGNVVLNPERPHWGQLEILDS